MNNSKRISAIVADDEKLSRDLLMDYLKDYPNIDVVATCSDGLKTLQAILELSPDIVFLDIQMPELTGIELIKELSESAKPVFVFTTAFEKYALDAFEVSATDYLLKPFTRERFRAAVEKACGYLLSSQQNEFHRSIEKLLETYSNLKGKSTSYVDKILIKEKKKLFLIAARDVFYFEGAGDYVSVHVSQRQYLIDESLTSIETKLDPSVFIRVHRSTIVNKTRVKEFIRHLNGEYILVLENDNRVKLSRSYKHLLSELIKDAGGN